MNEKWFNYAISLSIIMLFANAFITIGASQLSADGTQNTLFNASSQSDYLNQKNQSSFYVQPSTASSSSAPTQEQGITYIKRTSDNKNYNFQAIDYVVNMAVGVEVVMLQLSNIFPIVAPIFFAFAALAFLIKGVAVAWLATMAARQLFTGRFF